MKVQFITIKMFQDQAACAPYHKQSKVYLKYPAKPNSYPVTSLNFNVQNVSNDSPSVSDSQNFRSPLQTFSDDPKPLQRLAPSKLGKNWQCFALHQDMSLNSINHFLCVLEHVASYLIIKLHSAFCFSFLKPLKTDQ